MQETFIGEVIDEFLRGPGTDAAEEKRSARSGREQHVTIELPPSVLQKLPKLQVLCFVTTVTRVSTANVLLGQIS